MTLAQLPNEIMLMLMQSMREQPPVKIKEIRTFEVQFMYDSGVMLPRLILDSSAYRAGAISHKDGVIQIDDDHEACRCVNVCVETWNRINTDSSWRFMGLETMRESEHRTTTDDGDISTQIEHVQYAVFHRY